MKKLHLSILVIHLVFLQANVAFAGNGQVFSRNNAVGAEGVYSLTHIRARQEKGENYVVALVSKFATRADGKSVAIGWQIAKDLTDHKFYLHWHIRYADSDYPNVEKERWLYNYPVTQDQWHSLKIVHVNGNYWDLYFDGSKIVQVWWPHPTYNFAQTQLEAEWYQTPYWYLGHNKSIQILDHYYNWRLQDTTWPAHYRSIVYYSPVTVQQWYDWEGRDL